MSDLEYRYLGRTGVRVSPLCLGTMTFGDPTPPDEAQRMVDRALEAGLNFFDTANMYNRGESERVLGQAIQKTGLREHIVLATKCHGNMHKQQPLNPNRWGNSRRQIVRECEASLKRLGTDWIDLYQIHRPHPDCPIDETLRALDDLVTQGKILYAGCSTFAAWQVIESLWVSKELNLNRFVTEQPPYNLLDRRIERELIPMAQTYGMGVLPWSPLAGGFLTGKYRRDDPTPAGARFTRRRAEGRSPAVLETERSYDVAEQVAQLAQARGCTPGQFALAWCMQQPGVTSPILGPRTFEQLEDNLAALEVSITDADRQALDELVPPGTHAAPFYDARFGPHPHRWI
jgi:aryl-alcohol dehydrogenase-like predicted oxidoreductase